MSIEAKQPATFESPRLALIVWLTAAACGLFILAFVYGKTTTDFEQVTMGHATTSVFAEANGRRIHCSDDRDLDNCLTGSRAMGDVPRVLMLGNSQVHAINQYKPGDKGVAGSLFEQIHTDGRDLIVLSQPNANLQEHLAVFAAVTKKLKLTSLVLPVVFDDMREDGVRETLLATLHAEDTAKVLRSAPIGQKILSLNPQKIDSSETGAINETLQEQMEASANRWLDENTPFWAARKEARGDLLLGLYALRNTVFRIRPDTIRPVIPSRYANNRDALELILSMARDSQIKVVVYIAPIRQDAKLPYHPEQYASFKDDIAALAKKYGANFHNWEALVPVSDWGGKDATTLGGDVEIDYMHFQAAGHDRLAKVILEALK